MHGMLISTVRLSVLNFLDDITVRATLVRVLRVMKQTWWKPAWQLHVMMYSLLQLLGKAYAILRLK